VISLNKPSATFTTLSPAWKFLCISGEKCLQTIWNELSLEMEDLQYLNITQDMIWNAARARELAHPLTLEESKRILDSRETLAKEDSGG